jgi:predicted permease
MKFPRWRRSDDLNREIASHLEMAKRDRLERGESADEAEHAARREFGNVGLVRNVTREQWGWVWLEERLQDLRYGARTLRKNPGFTAIAILTLALGIGANTSLFSVVNGVLLNPLPYPHPEQLVTMHESKPNFKNGSISYPNFRDWQKQNHTFSGMAITRSYTYTLTGKGEAEQLRARFISSDFFSVLGVKPVIGRTFAPGEDEIGGPPLAIIGAGLWKRKFGASPEVLGKSLTLDGKDYTIVGVTPAAFDLFLRSTRITEVYVPIGQWSNPLLPRRGAGLGIHGVGRLKAGVSFEQASMDLESISNNLATAFPDTNNGITASLIPLRTDMLGNVQPILLVLLGAVGLVLLIACVNVANLLLARSTSRARELAIRSALGAGQGRLIRQLLTESVLLALAGGGIGLLLAQWATQAALSIVPAELPRAAEIRIDSHVLLFTMGVSLLAGILFGLAPALKTSQPRLHETLKESGRGASGTRQRAQSIFVAMEMAMALVLLIGAGLMIRSLTALWNLDPGFHPDHVLTFGLTLPTSMLTAPPAAIRAHLRDLDEKLAATPGVQALSESWGAVPMGNDDDQLFWIDGQPKPANENDMNWTLDYIVGPDYLRVMGIPLLRGRFFTPGDDEHAPLVGVVDEVFARKYFGDEDPIGKRINMFSIDLSSNGTKVEIVGVVGHVSQWGLDRDKTQPLRAQLYLPDVQMSDPYIANVPGGGGTYVMVRADGTVPGLLEALRQTARRMDSEQVMYSPETMDEIIAGTLAPRRFSMILLGVFAGLALLLASVGIYGVVSYLVGQRTHEIGLRMALGARRTDVLRLILGHGMKMALAGVAFGLAAAFGLTRLMAQTAPDEAARTKSANLLFGVSATDPLTFFAVALVLLLVALAACYIPARRAMRVDPMVALRYE